MGPSKEFLAALLAGKNIEIQDGGELGCAIKEMAGEILKKKNERKQTPPDELARMARVYLDRHDFKPGDRVRWKPGMASQSIPAEDEIAIVLEVKPGQVVTECDPTSSQYLSPNDLRVAVGANGGLVGLFVDGNRMEIVPEGETAPSPAAEAKAAEGNTSPEAIPEPTLEPTPANEIPDRPEEAEPKSEDKAPRPKKGKSILN